MCKRWERSREENRRFEVSTIDRRYLADLQDHRTILMKRIQKEVNTKETQFYAIYDVR